MAREMIHSGIEWIGEIPKEWRVELIGNNIKEIKDKNEDSSEDNALQFKMGTIISKRGGDSKYNPESLAAYTMVQEGDIVINGLNLSFDFISQRVGLVREKGVITSTYLTLRPSSLLYSDFVNYLFKAYDNCKAFHGMGRGLRQILSYRELRNQKLIYPSLAEQQKIANYLDKVCGEVDEMIALQEQMIEELKAYKQSVITEAVTKGLNPDVPMKDSASREQNHACMNYAEAQPVFERKFKDSGIDWIGEVPEGWECKKLKYIIDSMSKGNGITKEEVFADGDIPCVRYGEIYSKYNQVFKECISATKKEIQKSPRYFYKGDILCAGTGELVEEIGKSIVYLGEEECLAGGDIIVISHHQVPSFLNYALNSFYAQTQKSRGKAKLKVVHISASEIGSVYILLPPFSEQQSIASYLDTKCAEIDALIAIKQAKIEELKDYKKSVIYEYVTGKKEVV